MVGKAKKDEWAAVAKDLKNAGKRLTGKFFIWIYCNQPCLLVCKKRVRYGVENQKSYHCPRCLHTAYKIGDHLTKVHFPDYEANETQRRQFDALLKDMAL